MNVASPKYNEWRDTLTTIQEGSLRHSEDETMHQEDVVLVFRGEVDYKPERPIKSTLRRSLEERLCCLGEKWKENEIEMALLNLEMSFVHSALHHLRGSKALGHAFENLPDRSSLEYEQVLWKIQHQGGLTNQVDFTRSWLVALFFASEPNGLDGSVISLPTHSYYAREGGFIFWQDLDEPRLKSQRAVLIHPRGGKIRRDERVQSWKVPEEHKLAIRDYLEQFHGISEESLFPDIQGAVRHQYKRMKNITKCDLRYYLNN